MAKHVSHVNNAKKIANYKPKRYVVAELYNFFDDDDDDDESMDEESQNVNEPNLFIQQLYHSVRNHHPLLWFNDCFSSVTSKLVIKYLLLLGIVEICCLSRNIILGCVNSHLFIWLLFLFNM